MHSDVYYKILIIIFRTCECVNKKYVGVYKLYYIKILYTNMIVKLYVQVDVRMTLSSYTFLNCI